MCLSLITNRGKLFLSIYYVILFPFDNVNVRLLYEKLCHLEDMQLRVQNQILVL